MKRFFRSDFIYLASTASFDDLDSSRSLQVGCFSFDCFYLFFSSFPILLPPFSFAAFSTSFVLLFFKILFTVFCFMVSCSDFFSSFTGVSPLLFPFPFAFLFSFPSQFAAVELEFTAVFFWCSAVEGRRRVEWFDQTDGIKGMKNSNLSLRLYLCFFCFIFCPLWIM